jgi:hypothetical protein
VQLVDRRLAVLVDDRLGAVLVFDDDVVDALYVFAFDFGLALNVPEIGGAADDVVQVEGALEPRAGGVFDGLERVGVQAVLVDDAGLAEEALIGELDVDAAAGVGIVLQQENLVREDVAVLDLDLLAGELVIAPRRALLDVAFGREHEDGVLFLRLGFGMILRTDEKRQNERCHPLHDRTSANRNPHFL